MRTPPGFVDLFCGIGGLSLGLKRSGLRCLGAVDNWAEAVATYAENHSPEPCVQADLAETSAEELLAMLGLRESDLDILVGGPPCQGFSTVGKRDAADPRNRLWRHYLDLVDAMRPAYVLIENVEGLVVMDRGGVCEDIVASFESLGYQASWRLLRSCDFGVPQLRKRVIFLAHLPGLAAPRFPEPTTPHPLTVGDAIFDLPELAPGESAEAYSHKPTTDYQRRLRGRTRRLRNHQAANHPPHLVEILRHIPDGGNRKSIPDDLQPKSGFHNSYARLASDKPAVAVTSNMRKPSSARATHPRQNRGLTVREGLRLQTFEDSFVVLGSRTSQYLQVGNAVPPALAEAVGKEMLRAWSANRPEQIDRARRVTPSRSVQPQLF